MKKNPVEMLSIVNPGDGPEGTSLSYRDYQMLGVGAIAAGAGLWLIAQIRNQFILHTSPNQPLLTTYQSVGSKHMSGTGLLILGILGIGCWYVWSRYKTPVEAPEPKPLRNPEKKYRRREKHSASGARYFVCVVGTNEIYPKPESKGSSGGYSLRSAQDFARIGSQAGAARKVLRGSAHGPVVRKYEDGKRIWPVTVAQARTLRPVERPSQLRESA